MPKGWFNLEAGGSSSIVPDTSFFEGDSAFKFLNLSKTTRLYGFIGWCVPCQRSTSSPDRLLPQLSIAV